MSEKRVPVILTEQGLWLLYRATCCEIKVRNGLTKDVTGCDLWEFTTSLDMSFEEIRNEYIENWRLIIRKDVEELSSEIITQL
ncbi:hypothetical protein HOS16_gp09 [Shigella phage vB_SflS-ISF001]|uniref:Uncharacterized protein n=1 Tax=Shigella phage vB_SflS-ISF001 TaxID=2048005 RepID=A0A2D1GPZ4_9CAUD|nr:hypothetical protein HOS16_gp09 [Shigella phage vB_SflS-ISF001]ATN94087.1 hypothetical protein FLXISF001_009 [Shigella phage vB_SflS-ISF001]